MSPRASGAGEGASVNCQAASGLLAHFPVQHGDDGRRAVVQTGPLIFTPEFPPVVPAEARSCRRDNLSLAMNHANSERYSHNDLNGKSGESAGLFQIPSIVHRRDHARRLMLLCYGQTTCCGDVMHAHGSARQARKRTNLPTPTARLTACPEGRSGLLKPSAFARPTHGRPTYPELPVIKTFCHWWLNMAR